MILTSNGTSFRELISGAPYSPPCPPSAPGASNFCGAGGWCAAADGHSLGAAGSSRSPTAVRPAKEGNIEIPGYSWGCFFFFGGGGKDISRCCWLLLTCWFFFWGERIFRGSKDPDESLFFSSFRKGWTKGLMESKGKTGKEKKWRQASTVSAEIEAWTFVFYILCLTIAFAKFVKICPNQGIFIVGMPLSGIDKMMIWCYQPSEPSLTICSTTTSVTRICSDRVLWWDLLRQLIGSQKQMMSIFFPWRYPTCYIKMRAK